MLNKGLLLNGSPFLILKKRAMLIKNVKNILFDTIPGSKSPARYYWDYQIIVVNVPVWQKMNSDQRLFVLLHEVGHAHLQTKNEIEADAWALSEYLKLGGKLTNSLLVLTNNLNENDPEGYARIVNQFSNLAAYDIEVNNNQNLKKLMNTPQIDNYELFPIQNSQSDFLGFGKRAEERREERQERREARQERREERHNANLAIKQARADRIASGGPSLLDKGLDTVKGVFGGGSTPTGLDYKTTDPIAPPKKNNTMYIIIAVVVVVILGVAFFYFKKKKK